MTSATFTPGPWRQEHRKGAGGMWNTEVFCSKGETIATLAWYPRPEAGGVVGTYREANACLMAAAPEMFQTLVDMDGWLANCGYAADHPWRISLRAAIAKATGGAA